MQCPFIIAFLAYASLLDAGQELVAQRYEVLLTLI